MAALMNDISELKKRISSVSRMCKGIIVLTTMVIVWLIAVIGVHGQMIRGFESCVL